MSEQKGNNKVGDHREQERDESLRSPHNLTWSVLLLGVNTYTALTSSICFTTYVFLVHQRLLNMQYSPNFLKGAITLTITQSCVKPKRNYFVEQE